MIFEEIKIHNLFSYYHEQVFDLRNTLGENCNIVLISGRNGFGKTSFLNSVKILFSGITESLRRSVQRGRMPNVRQYVLGVGENWLGMMNRKARAEGENECGIQIVWQEPLGKVQVSRRWILNGDNAEMSLTIEASFLNEVTTGNEAQNFLNERLPPDYLAFFFFDGEQIQALAEANPRVQQQQMEQLLNISPIDTLREYLNKVITDWRRDALDQETKTALAKLEDELKYLAEQQVAKQQRISSINYDIDELEKHIRQLERLLDGMRAFRYQRDEVRLQEKLHSLEAQKIELQTSIAKTLPRDIPLLANTQLVKQTLTQLQQLSNYKNDIQINLLKILVQQLPTLLFDSPPFPKTPLNEEQKNFYKVRLNSILDKPISKLKSSTTTLLSLETSRANQILEQLQPYLVEELSMERIKQLQQLSQLKSELKIIDERLENLSSLSSDERIIYEQRQAEKKKQEAELINKKARFQQLQIEIKALETEIDKKKLAIKQQQKQVELSRTLRQKVERAEELRNFFTQLKDNLKERQREQIEQAINKYFPILMTSHQMISYIRVDSEFQLHYQDAQGQSIGSQSFSSGMKQLTATALLWALKEVSGKNIPVIIDTPMARIDREHQENLLQQYYPKVSEQVIILPTNSELDERKYKLLTPYIYQEYCLSNSQGDLTEVHKQAMYS